MRMLTSEESAHRLNPSPSSVHKADSEFIANQIIVVIAAEEHDSSSGEVRSDATTVYRDSRIPTPSDRG